MKTVSVGVAWKVRLGGDFGRGRPANDDDNKKLKREREKKAEGKTGRKART